MATLAGIVPAERAGQLNQLADKVGRATNTTSTSSKKPKNKNTNQSTSVDDKKLKNICIYLTECLREHRDPGTNHTSCPQVVTEVIKEEPDDAKLALFTAVKSNNHIPTEDFLKKVSSRDGLLNLEFQARNSLPNIVKEAKGVNPMNLGKHLRIAVNTDVYDAVLDKTTKITTNLFGGCTADNSWEKFNANWDAVVDAEGSLLAQTSTEQQKNQLIDLVTFAHCAPSWLNCPDNTTRDRLAELRSISWAKHPEFSRIIRSEEMAHLHDKTEDSWSDFFEVFFRCIGLFRDESRDPNIRYTAALYVNALV